MTSDPVEEARQHHELAAAAHAQAEADLVEARSALEGFIQRIEAGDSKAASSLANKRAAVDLAEIAAKAAARRAEAAERAHKVTVVDWVSRQVVEDPLLNGDEDDQIRQQVASLVRQARDLATAHYERRNRKLADAVQAAEAAGLPVATNDQFSDDVLVQEPLAPLHRISQGLYFTANDLKVLPVDPAKSTRKLIAATDIVAQAVREASK